MTTWREPKALELELGLDDADDAQALATTAARRLGVREEDIEEVRLLRRALDCRRGRIRFHLSLEVLPRGGPPAPRPLLGEPFPVRVAPPSRVVIVGDGPAGLFCAYQLARQGVASTVVDRGKPVQPRRRDLKGLNQHGRVDSDSNYCFGEGGAGTYSDGKLYTRSHKRGDVRDVIEILAGHGAPDNILTEARPHIGSNRLPKVITAMRERLEAVGVEFRFGSAVAEVVVDGQRRVEGVRLRGGELIAAEHVVLATGHSARDVFAMLERAGHPLEAKGFALGVRIEHPQKLINRIQYGEAAAHPRLPSAAYHLADSREHPGGGGAVFSFCMCPGGFIVPAATHPGEVVVNGMSLSKRDSAFANSGLVMAVEPERVAAAGFGGPLGGLELQSAVERSAFDAGGGSLAAPATRVRDFIERRASRDVPKSSYQPGLVPGDLWEVLAASRLPVAEALRTALLRFDRRLRGYLDDDAVLVGVETRTSSPVRIPRRPTLESAHWSGFYPAGEGAGFAGGIVSAAVDGMRVARAVAQRVRG